MRIDGYSFIDLHSNSLDTRWVFLKIFFLERKKITYLDMTTTFYFKLKIAFGKKDEPI